ncbi:MAG: alpha/beta fold hydrolase [Elusimicrobiaceae bacterium]|nr:alpha/beta fold hydrolase [Elusimicrobiaceae bacterium]
MKKIGLWVMAALMAMPVFAQEEMKGRPAGFQTQDGWAISALYQPAEENQKTLLLLHDVGKSYVDFATFSAKLTEKGFGYLALDLRGHGKSIGKGVYSSFAKEGVDNDYNKMTRDVNAAMDYLKGKGVPEEDVFLVGAGMGANVAAKSASLWPNVAGVALLTPVTNFRDVLPISALRVYKGNVFIASAADDKKNFLEASVMRNVSFLSSGEGKVTFATAYHLKGHEMLDKWVTEELIQWLQTPQKPQIRPDVIETSEDSYEGDYEDIPASSTEEALFPSILQ